MALLGQVVRGVREHWAAVERDDRDAREVRGYVARVGAWVPEPPVARAQAESSAEGPGPQRGPFQAEVQGQALPPWRAASDG